MSTSILQVKGRGVLLHNAVAEVWVTELLRQMEPERGGSGPLRGLLLKAEEALPHNWLTGVLFGSFDEFVQDDVSFAAFARYLSAANAALRALPVDERGVANSLGRPVSEAFLLPELEMIETLFLDPERVRDPSERFALGRGWHP